MAAITTPWVSLPGKVTAECRDDGVHGYLAVGTTAEAGDVRAEGIG